MIKQWLLGVAGAMAIALYLVSQYALKLNEQRAQYKFESQQFQRQVSHIKKERALWEQARINLNKSLQQSEQNAHAIQQRYQKLEKQSRLFLSQRVPADVADILFDSDMPNLAAWLHATGRPAATNNYRPAYQQLTNQAVYNQREQCLAALNQCNAVLGELRNAYYPANE